MISKNTMLIRFKNLSLIVVVAAVVTGCATTGGPGVYGSVDDALASYERKGSQWQTKPYQMKIKPIVGSRQNDAKVIINTGKVLKVLVFPYKQERSLVASHDVYTMVEKPSFVVGEMVPSGKRTGGITTCQTDYPFVFKDRHLETVNPRDRFKDKNIRAYANNTYKAEKNPKKYYKKKRKKAKKYDATIKDYIK